MDMDMDIVNLHVINVDTGGNRHVSRGTIEAAAASRGAGGNTGAYDGMLDNLLVRVVVKREPATCRGKNKTSLQQVYTRWNKRHIILYLHSM